jgi:hypothetical protein
MMRHHCFAVLAATGLVAGCANPDAVLFVTDTTIGMSADNTPPSVSIAYDRTEGYIAPRYQNGGVPPVVGSIETGGTIFAPTIKQVYATGAAAVKAVGAPNAPDGPKDLSGDPAQKRLVFFGTATTLGIKVGFAPSGAPDSMNIGFRRKEFSLIPLGAQTANGQTADVYPSVLATIDTTATAASLSGTGLTSKQFFATGQAAEVLATNPAVVGTFGQISQDSVAATLTPAQQQAALAGGTAARTSQDDKVTTVMAAVAPGGTLDKTKLASLIDAANAKVPGAVPADLKTETTAASVKNRIQNNQPIATALANALGAPPAAK